jgi:hypothetical protein
MSIVSRIKPVKLASGVALAALASLSLSGFALGKDKDDGDDSSAKDIWPPNIYLDLRTTYATIPANTLAIGLGPVDSKDSLLSANQIQGFFWGGGLECDGSFGFERRGLGADGAADHRSA